MSFVVNEPISREQMLTIFKEYDDYINNTSVYMSAADELYAGKSNVPLTREKTCRLCPCYSKDSDDSRCCGLCYFCCPGDSDDNTSCQLFEKTLWCYDNKKSYNIMGRKIINSENEWCACIVCAPFSIGCFIPCVLGGGFNHCINNLRDTNSNYLF